MGSADAGPVALPISLPKGGGAIHGMGEKFAANPVTGTGATTIPIGTSPGRSGFSPQLSLSYDSGAGNGAFGFGWMLSVPSITRKTDKGLPRYADSEESDVFILSGAEDLVPVLDSNNNRMQDDTTASGFRIQRYRPRIEGLFARIEKWTRLNDNDVHWRSISKDNVLTLYGADLSSRIADPEDSTRIFSWLICETRDDKGNGIVYEFKAEDGSGVVQTDSYERNRGALNDSRRAVNRYLKHIRYGNRATLLDVNGNRPRFLTDAQRQGADWMFEVVFDYGEHNANAPLPDDPGVWDFRQDPFSTYRAGFEVRTCRLCSRVLMFHHFPNEPSAGDNCLVRSTDFTYSSEPDPNNAAKPVYTFLLAATQNGYVRKNSGYLKRGLPPVEFGYTEPVVDGSVLEVTAKSLEDLPVGVDGAGYQWTDLHGEGSSGILTEQGGAWFYKRNLSPANAEATFAPVEVVASKPNLAFAGGRAQLVDLDGDGVPDLAVLDGPTPGLYEHDEEEGWDDFRPFTSPVNLSTHDPSVRIVDLDGDGHADLLILGQDALVWYPSLAIDGFAAAQRLPAAFDEEKGPQVVFADGTQSIYVADLSGDGLNDLVRIRNGEVCYWPNLGYGRFGAKITMESSPLFDHPDQFDQRRIRLADIDGSGTTDIIYLHRDGVRLYFNQSGNRWSQPEVVPAFPGIDDVESIMPMDLLGNGTACLVWSSPLPGNTRRQMRYVDLMGGRKPHLLISMKNNLGAETRVDYAPSTKFYLLDKAAGRPWITRLPFPVHVVECVETYDWISGNRFVSRYAYHHGYFDGVEREFRGFGMVEQWDTEQFDVLQQSSTFPMGANIDAASHVPPAYVKTWFHTGAYIDRTHISNYFAGSEYYEEPGQTAAQTAALLLPDTLMPDGLSGDEEEEACRALKGMMLRQEVYALDGTGTESYPSGHPYTVTEQNFTINTLQLRGPNRHAVFFTHARETVSYHYERNPADPRVTHELALETDDYGNALRNLSVAYGRRQSPLAEQHDRDKQTAMLITYVENSVTNAIDDAGAYPDDYRTPLPAETQTYELTGFVPGNNAMRFSFGEWAANGFALIASAAAIPYEQAPDRTPQKRLIADGRTLYRKNDLSAFLQLGIVEPRALAGQAYHLALTQGLVTNVFQQLPSPGSLLEGTGPDQGGYVAIDGNWWVPSNRILFDSTAATELSTAQQHFYLPRVFVEPFGQTTQVNYDTYDLMVTSSVDAVQNQIAVVNDYRVLQPQLITDANNNQSAAAFDAFGMVVATAVMGKQGEMRGDLLEGFDADPALADLQAFISAPQGQAPVLLGSATTRIVYDLDRFHRCGQPPFAAILSRETHLRDPNGSQTAIQISFSYSDGFGREIQKKVQAEPGAAPARSAPVSGAGGDIAPGSLVLDASGALTFVDAQPRWVGNGRVVFNNKGKPVRQYEPFFSSTHLYEQEREMTDTGVSSIVFYDPLDRAVASLHPNHTYDKVVFGAWQQTTYDVNDTVTLDPSADDDVKPSFVYLDGTPRIPGAEYLPTWYGLRTDPANAAQAAQLWPDSRLRTAEQNAATAAALYANTPSTAHLDVLGRTFLTFADNGPDPAQPGAHLLYAGRVELDIQGNQRVVRDAVNQNADALGRIVMQYDYDILGRRIHQASMEAGERWILNDVTGKPIRTWDSRLFQRRMTYDPLRRPTGLYVTENGQERLAEQTLYGEAQGDGQNHRTRIYKVFDNAGVVTNAAYDFKGNLLQSQRDLFSGYKQAVDWQQNPSANYASYSSSTVYDALNRPVSVTSPDGSVHVPTFNEANLLETVSVNLRGASVGTPFVSNVDYDAKGQRTRIDYGNGATTTYEYDPLTFRVTHLKTTRASGLNGVSSQIFNDTTVIQDLHYIYDPFGNITQIQDWALKSIVYNGQQVQPAGVYTYDAIYRLIQAQGREHIGQNAFNFSPVDGNYRDYPFMGQGASPNDLSALWNYTQTYDYDEAGNIKKVQHSAGSAGWTRTYQYNEASLLESGKQSNRLSGTTVGNGINYAESYGHDEHGNMKSMPHLAAMIWDFKDELTEADLSGGGTAYYVYDASGQRIRKVIESQNGIIQKERIYVAGFEVYREFSGSISSVNLQRESVHIMDDRNRIALVETETIDSGNPINAPAPLQRYQLGNHLHSASVELADDGSLISYEEYHPYGTTAFQAGRTGAEVSLKRYRYAAKERDEQTGFDYYGARYYAPWLGRWTSCDPASRVERPNLYQFVLGNPIGLVDQIGLSSKNPKIMQNQEFDPVSPESRASTGVQVSGFSKTVSVEEVPGFGTQITHEFLPLPWRADAKGQGKMPRVFSSDGKTYMGTGSKDELVMAMEDVEGVNSFTAREAFIYMSEVKKASPESFFLENVVEPTTLKMISEGKDFSVTPIGKSLTRGAAAIGLDVKNVQIVENAGSGLDIRGNFAPKASPGSGGLPPTGGTPSPSPEGQGSAGGEGSGLSGGALEGAFRGGSGAAIGGLQLLMVYTSMKEAELKANEQGSFEPIKNETIRQVGGLGGGIAMGELGALYGLPEGPAGIAIGFGLGFIGGFLGYHLADPEASTRDTPSGIRRDTPSGIKRGSM